MPETQDLLLSVDNYRAIKKARISIGDITVVAGPNGSGKSTISHMIHSICNLSIMYPKYLIRHLWEKIAKMVDKTRDIGGCLSGTAEGQFAAIGGQKATSEAQPDFARMMDEASFQEVIERIRQYSGKVLSACRGNVGGDVSRAFVALKTLLKPDGDVSDVDGVLAIVNSRLDEIKTEYESCSNIRQYMIYNEASEMVRKWLWSSGEIKFLEAGNPVYGTVRTTSGIGPVDDLKRIYSISRALYITSPLASMPSFVDKERIGFNDGFTFLAKVNPSFNERELFSVVDGKVDANDDKDVSGNSAEWTYTRSDGLKVDLDMCATGLKSFSILQILCKYSLLDEGTLLIVDEPEAHLHPKWIVEYAKVLVELVRRLKIRLLIATHSPYFLNSLERIIPEERIGSAVRFYEMREVDTEKKMFESFDVSSNLEPIYKSMYEPFVR